MVFERDGAGGRTNGHDAVGKILRHDGSGADGRPRTDAAAGQHDRADADERPLADRHVSAEAHTGSDVRMIADEL